MRKQRFQDLNRFPDDDPGRFMGFQIPESMFRAIGVVAEACGQSKGAMIRQAISELLERIYQARTHSLPSGATHGNP